MIQDSLTLTADDTWVIWAHKVARSEGDSFRPLTGGDGYPRDAIARWPTGANKAPKCSRTCGFHA